ncbi:hypothetical protein [Streptomyces candidus]|uniref:Uncharacterized protein n=1 Tax=Streptomyces candidus TaxID=67283 RepID=A0A7X0LSU8_9ACTN|nr:hypothetical protein [Streptomyces candidus]MBB6439587.1 hypothetical protein [Streptomyces candidus]GHH54674.1 hypothetical protein GCM10018773_58010 [Streptomyces candidus]
MSESAFSRATAVAVAEAVRPWLSTDVDEPPPAAAIVAALRTAEAEHSGHQRDLWGHAVGNATCAMTAQDNHSARWLWATVLDYARLATAANRAAAVTLSGGVPEPAPA